MCGISGFFHSKGVLDEQQLQVYNKELHHRGPDGNDTFFKKVNNGSIGLAHVRLSILDLSELGKQPMQFEHLTITLNGEIYNFAEIKADLLKIGYTFKSGSDTEVVLKSFHAWGVDAVKRFTGMWAFVIYDALANKLYLCRDRAGVKPLYWYKDGTQFIFGSELKVFFSTSTFKAQIDKDSLKTFINYGYITNNDTLLKGVYKAEAGAWTLVDLNSLAVTVYPYWSYSNLFEAPQFSGSYADALIEAENHLKKACELRMVADVPVGVFLSGGFDSTLVTSILQANRTQKLKTFTIGFSDGVDESPDAAKIAAHLGTEHTSYDCKQKDAMELIPQLPFLFDDPIADISCIPTMLVSKLARQEVTVALSADGGDELFAGYNGFKSTPELLKKLAKIPLPKLSGNVLELSLPFLTGDKAHLHKKIKGVAQILKADKADKIYELHKNQLGLPDELINGLFLEPASIRYHQHSKARLRELEDDLFILGVEDVLKNLLLVKVDRAAMGYSLEGREPLLDHHLMAFAASLPYAFKHNGQTSKRLLRDTVYKYVPKELMDRPKIGFDLPIYKWLKGELGYLLDESLNKEYIAKQGIFNPEYIQQIVNGFKNNSFRYNGLIWNLLVFQMWAKKWNLI